MLGTSTDGDGRGEHVDQDEPGEAADRRGVDVRVLERPEDEPDIGEIQQWAGPADDRDECRAVPLALCGDVECRTSLTGPGMAVSCIEQAFERWLVLRHPDAR